MPRRSTRAPFDTDVILKTRSSNTALSGMVQRYKNAVCIVAPAILDSHIVVSADSSYLRLIRHMLVWGHTAQGKLPHAWPSNVQFTNFTHIAF